VSLGNFLIKRVAEELKRDFPALRNFATLSPIPGFGRWLRSAAAAQAVLPAAVQTRLKKVGIEAANARELAAAIAGRNWRQEPKLTAALEEPLCFACAHYLVEGRNGLRPLDSVARFHLDNGARIERLNWLADTSEKGIEQSAGIMVNYVYDPGDIERNHEAYRLHGKVALSGEIRRLLRR
jgi:malonyl-CoA decarboxylase